MGRNQRFMVLRYFIPTVAPVASVLLGDKKVSSQREVE
jgi:hypothetical protein